MNIAAGTHLDRYEIRSQIGAGGMGEVYWAQDTQLRRRVALKILPGDIAANRDRMRRFVQEAQAAAALNHPTSRTFTNRRVGWCELYRDGGYRRPDTARIN